MSDIASSDSFSRFVCPHCNTELEASPDMIGVETECPACGAKLVIPDNRDDGIERHGADDAAKAMTQAMKSRTIRIELGDL